MQYLKGTPLHQARFAGIRITCPSELSSSIEEYFKNNGFDIGRVTCFSANAPDMLSVTFELLSRAKKFAEVIMGLLNRNDV
ncbi:hypothetical protein ACGABA_003487, partial [Escherichia coli]